MSTHSYARLEVTESTYNEIKEALEKAGYSHAIMCNSLGEVLLMDELGLVLKQSIER